MTIKHLVISGGGPSGLLTYGIASYLEMNDFGNYLILRVFMVVRLVHI